MGSSLPSVGCRLILEVIAENVGKKELPDSENPSGKSRLAESRSRMPEAWNGNCGRAFISENRVCGRLKELQLQHCPARQTDGPLAISVAITRSRGHTAVHHGSYTGTGTSDDRGVSAQHSNTRAELRSTERYHVFANMCCNNLSVLWVGMGEYVLDQVVPILIARNIDQRDPWTIKTSFADAIKIAAEKFGTANFKTFLDNLRGKLIHRVLRGIPDDMVDGSASICRSTMLTDVLNTPVAKLTVGNNINVGQDFFNARTLEFDVS